MILNVDYIGVRIWFVNGADSEQKGKKSDKYAQQDICPEWKIVQN
jgi:hypothetical protein